MELYGNFRVSGVTHYEFGEDYINLKFKGKSRIYRYCVSYQVEIMKGLALAGRGLNTYVNKVNPRFR
jgi:hypothetical protein